MKSKSLKLTTMKSKSLKVKVVDLSKLTSSQLDKELKRTKELRIAKAKALFQSRPFVTKTWLSLNGFPMEFLKENWAEITS